MERKAEQKSGTGVLAPPGPGHETVTRVINAIGWQDVTLLSENCSSSCTVLIRLTLKELQGFQIHREQ